MIIRLNVRAPGVPLPGGRFLDAESRLVRSRVRLDLVAVVTALSAPAALFVHLGKLPYAVVVFFGPLSLLLGYYSLRRQAVEWSAVVVGSIPVISSITALLTKGGFFIHGILYANTI